MAPMTTNTTPRKPFYTRWWFITLVVLVVLGAIGQTLGGDDEPAAAPASTQAASTPATEPSPEPSETGPRTEYGYECLAVSEEVANHVAWAMDEKAAPAEVGAVKSKEADSYVIAVRLAGGYLDGDKAIFETMNIETSSILLAVDGFAREFTDFPDSVLGVADEPSDAAVACME